MRTNQRGDYCAARPCTMWVQPGEGVLVRGPRRWMVYCQEHAPAPEGDAVLWGSGLKIPPPNGHEGHVHDPLAAFLLARVEEESADAGNAWLTHWRQPSPESWIVADDHDEQVAQCKEIGIARHMARWNPLYVLDHESARRHIIDAYEEASAGSPQRHALECVLRLLTLPYADHPDWNPAWLRDKGSSRCDLA